MLDDRSRYHRFVLGYLRKSVLQVVRTTPQPVKRVLLLSSKEVPKADDCVLSVFYKLMFCSSADVLYPNRVLIAEFVGIVKCVLFLHHERR